MDILADAVGVLIWACQAFGTLMREAAWLVLLAAFLAGGLAVALLQCTP